MKRHRNDQPELEARTIKSKISEGTQVGFGTLGVVRSSDNDKIKKKNNSCIFLRLFLLSKANGYIQSLYWLYTEFFTVAFDSCHLTYSTKNSS